MVGEGWRDLFDVIIVEVGQIIQSPSCNVVYLIHTFTQAGKPHFFTNNGKPFREVDLDKGVSR